MSMKKRLPQGGPFPDFLIPGKARCFPVFYSFRRSAKQGGLLQNPNILPRLLRFWFQSPNFLQQRRFSAAFAGNRAYPHKLVRRRAAAVSILSARFRFWAAPFLRV